MAEENDKKKLTDKDAIEKSLLELSKEYLSYLTLDAPENEYNPVKVSKTVELLEVLEKKILPVGFGEEDFLLRFNKANGRDENAGKKNNHAMRYRKKFSQVAAAILVFVAVGTLLNQISYADNDPNEYQIVNEQQDRLAFGRRKSQDMLPNREANTSSRARAYSGVKVSLEDLLTKGYDNLYLPIKLLAEQDNYEVQYLDTGDENTNILFNYYNAKTLMWLSIRILDKAGLSAFTYADWNILENVFCMWDNAKFYAQSETGLIAATFEIKGRLYSITSNQKLEEVSRLINMMEVFTNEKVNETIATDSSGNF